MSKTAKVTKALSTGKTWVKDDKTFYFHEIEFDNGDSGEYMSIKDDQTKFIEGQTAEYDLIPKDGYPDKIKPVQAQGNRFGSGGGKRGSNASFALSYAKDLACANITKGEHITGQQVTVIADHFLKWLNDNE